MRVKNHKFVVNTEPFPPGPSPSGNNANMTTVAGDGALVDLWEEKDEEVFSWWQLLSLRVRSSNHLGWDMSRIMQMLYSEYCTWRYLLCIFMG
jgi:hypothetical protein